MQRRELMAAAGLLAASPWTQALPDSAAKPKRKVLRTAFNSAEVGFDPPQVSDRTSVAVNAHIFESPLTYDLLARPVQLRPQTAAGLPEVSADFKRFVFTIRPGIFFADDPVFQGRRRELVAQDYVYTVKRFYDPRLKTEHLYQFENAKILGLSELRQHAIERKTAFDYDREVTGLRALDRYRFEVRLAEPDPRFVYLFANAGYTGAVAREVVEAYAEDLLAHPVGTGPFRLKHWRRSSQIVLERNPGFREEIFEPGEVPPDAQSQAIAQALKGRRLPLLDEVQISIIVETQPRWLAFNGGELDLLEMPTELAPLAMPGGQLAPNLRKRGVQAFTSYGADIGFSFFNMEDPVVGGLSPERVALRRAIVLGYDNEAEIRIVYKGQAVPAQTMLPQMAYGHDPALRSEAGRHDMARARALLDLYGYDQRDAEGYRLQPDGSRLTLRRAGTAGSSRQRMIDELWKKQMDALGLRIEFESATFGELIKKALAKQLMIWGYIWSVGDPDGDFLLGMGYGPNAGQSNDAQFRLPAYDALYARQRLLANSPERWALLQQLNRLLLSYMPDQPHNHPLRVDLCQAGVRGFIRHPFTRDGWRFVDLVT
ncbi:ABC transporter substrate-binding protein [Kinneretia aquatilis]|uniref:ABC transporter substrate-binding protein n=1 Tax=Kinneretia aquatilis TaxID=2070761 RepID=UPI0014953A24|nr:ABC transporter substrate-binding protein [Paucibacter aquatile]WIV97793.1 ABC transporter substrate-binding protein [Paucibacter aquatile]